MISYASKEVRKWISIASSIRSISSHVESASIGVQGPSFRTMSLSASKRARGPTGHSMIWSISYDTNPNHSSSKLDCRASIKSSKAFGRPDIFILYSLPGMWGLSRIESLEKQNRPVHQGGFYLWRLRFGTYVPLIERSCRSRHRSVSCSVAGPYGHS